MATIGGMLLGHDLSTVLQCEKSGVKYYDFDSSECKPPEQIVAAHGANLVRLRLWVNPPAGFSDYASVLEMAKRAKKANLKVLLCLHLSDYWADPGKQFTPGAWANQDCKTLCKTVEEYVRYIIEALQRQGTPPFIVAVGNEVSNGILWPTDGAKLSDLKSSLETAATRYNKPMVVVEVAESWAPSPNCPETQESLMTELLKVVSSVPRGLGAGVCYWESAWVPPGEAYPGEGCHYGYRALWNEQGRPLPALRCYEFYAKGPLQPTMHTRRHHFWGLGRSHEGKDEL
uniref:arabinogalactan endo-beta-1,4-galactanase n=1 Tax=Physcomitrium patens TaxID=3218 RepID=A0A7I4AKN3_PHYPA